MEYNKQKIDEMVLALLYLTSFPEKNFTRTWKGHDWEVLNRLHEKGYISDPKSKAKSVVFSEEGLKKSEELFKEYFT